MKELRKFVSMLMIGLFMAFMPTSVIAYDFSYRYKGTTFYFNITSDTECQVTSGDTEYSGSVSIPSSASYLGTDYSVTSIGSSAFSGSDITSVTIPESVTSIGSGAFSYTPLYSNSSNWYDDVLYISNCLISASNKKTGSYTIKRNTRIIANNAFQYCSISSVSIPNTVTHIGFKAFSCCSQLTSVTIPESVTYIGDGAFADCSGLTSVTIPETVTSINKEVFSYCSSLTSVTIPSSVTSIGSSAFAKCYGLTSMSIPDQVETIGYKAFYYCSNLASVSLPNSIISIGDYAFFNCSSLNNLSIPASVTSIGEYALNGTGLYNDKSNWEDNTLYVSNCLIKVNSAMTGEYTIKDATRIIAAKAFEDCKGLTSVTIPNSVTHIGDDVFDDCNGLTSISIPNSVTHIGKGAFDYCRNLESIDIPNSVTFIGNHAFYYCTSLTSVIIPESVTSIGSETFMYCSALASVTIPGSITTIDDYAFSGCLSLSSVSIPASVTSIGKNAFYACEGLTSVKVCNNDPANILLDNDVFYRVPTSTCILYVPVGSKELYAKADQWKEFCNIEEFDPSMDGIEDTLIFEPVAPDEPFYDLMGRKVTNPTAGIYIQGGKKVMIQ